MEIFTTKPFARFAGKAKIPDTALCRTVADAERGLIEADLGGGVIKQRIARPGRGKSGGFRVLIAFRALTRSVFVHGFAKNEKDNIDGGELAALKRLAAELLGYDAGEIRQAIANGVLVEVTCGEKTVS